MIQHAHILNDQQHCENFCWSEPEQTPRSEPETVNEGLDIHDEAPYPSLHDEDGVCYKSTGNFNTTSGGSTTKYELETADIHVPLWTEAYLAYTHAIVINGIHFRLQQPPASGYNLQSLLQYLNQICPTVSCILTSSIIHLALW